MQIYVSTISDEKFSLSVLAACTSVHTDPARMYSEPSSIYGKHLGHECIQ